MQHMRHSDELAEDWTLLENERALLANKTGATRLGFVILLKFFGLHGRFPHHATAVPDDVVVYLARQVHVPAELYRNFDWAGRTIALHKTEATLLGMGKAYSQDVRVRVLAALDGGMSKMAVHRTFRISRSTIDDWVAVRATPGHVRPHAPARRGPPPAIADLKAFTAFMHQHNDGTLAQLAQAWKQATGRQLRRNPLWLALRRMGWTRKKRALPTPRETTPNAQRCGST